MTINNKFLLNPETYHPVSIEHVVATTAEIYTFTKFENGNAFFTNTRGGDLRKVELDKDVIEQAKDYAYHKQQSLSALVEQYFRFLVVREQEPEVPDISPTIQQLSGILDPVDGEAVREDYTDFLVRKYSS